MAPDSRQHEQAELHEASFGGLREASSRDPREAPFRRTYAKAHRSLQACIDGVPDPNAMNLPNDGTWHWTTGDSFNLGAGLHTLHVWQCEAGARVDVVALTTNSTPPP